MVIFHSFLYVYQRVQGVNVAVIQGQAISKSFRVIQVTHELGVVGQDLQRKIHAEVPRLLEIFRSDVITTRPGKHSQFANLKK